ncbi:MAG: AMP-binding protein, partial [Gammaproteobacteria bacterium]|nr:AMP-binding protein [Gammaproteobacteria bacterium]
MTLLHHLIQKAADRDGSRAALYYRGEVISYSELANQVARASGGLIEHGIRRGERIAIYLPRQPEAVVAFFASTMAGAVFVPVNPQLKSAQVAHILGDCGARMLITTAARAATLAPVIADCTELETIVLCDDDEAPVEVPGNTLPWNQLVNAKPGAGSSIDTDLAALLYTSGSTGRPKGVMLSHRNLVAGAVSVSDYLQNRPDDRLLTVLPFSFDYGFSQLSTAFLIGASVVLFDYLRARDVIRAVERDRITGLACVPPVWIQLARLQWPDTVAEHLRYITNSGGAMPATTLKSLRSKLPKTRIYLMYGLTEAFRSTYLDPDEVDERPTSIGKAIPNAEVLVVRADGRLCGP